MKKLIATLAVLAMAPGAMAANGEFTNSAEFRVRHTTNMQEETRNNESHMDHRLLWNVDYRSGEKFSGHLGVIHYSRWGTDNGGENTFTASGDANNLNVNQAYASWMVSDDSVIKAGRMPINIGDWRVMGPNGYGNQPRAYSSFHFGHDTEFANIGVYAFKLSERITGGYTSGAGSQDPENNAYLFNFDFKSLPEFLKMANLHIIKLSDNEATLDTSPATKTLSPTADNQMRYGLTLGGDTMGINYRLTYAAISGDSGTTGKTDYSSSMMDFELGYSMPDMMNFKVGLGYHTDTGDKDGATPATDGKNEHYDAFAYHAHANAGLMDIVNWGNLTDTSLNVSFDAAGMNWGFQYHMFAATEKDDTSGANYTLAGPTPDPTKTDLGSEIDFKVTHKYADNFKISALVGQFTHGERLTGTGTIKDKQKVTLEGTWTF